ncbi:MAG: YkgJ family cysteine cluster protein [Myxococcales bacterium]|nr:YkgJ family cysteine cluster protein [Myxococcales bacterium]MCB9749241.1 YkgJ family cysteine cluster protein [Myxococcales bacterium]
MKQLRVLVDERSPEARQDALERAREQPTARLLLDQAVAPLRRLARRLAEDPDAAPLEELWPALDEAYAALDRYLGHLLERSGVTPRCGAGCPACCTAAPTILPIEGLRMARALRRRDDGQARLLRAAQQSSLFHALLQRALARSDADAREVYLETQLRWRARGMPCPALDDDGRCAAYESRPLACRAYVSVEEPARCLPSDPAFVGARRPLLWRSDAEARFEALLSELGDALELPRALNLLLALPRLFDHPALDA